MRCLQAFNDGNSTTDAVTNVAPYWRVALEPHWGPHYLMVGTFGMYGQIMPGRQYGYGTDNYLDVGFDSQYQYDGDQYSVTVKLTDIMEWQTAERHLRAWRLVEYRQHPQQLQGQRVVRVGSHLQPRLRLFQRHRLERLQSLWLAATTCFARPTALVRLNNSYNSSPNGDGLILDLAYIPFAHGAPGPYGYTTWNARIGIQFTEYLHLYGGSNNFDGSLSGRHA